MKRSTAVLAGVLLCASLVPLFAQSEPSDDQQALRARIEQRYDVVLVSNGVALRPKTKMRDVRLIEISDTILVNGVPVTGRELAERVGSDAESILRLSYLDPEARRTLFTETTPEPETRPEAERSPDTPSPAPALSVPPETRARMSRVSAGDRIRVFGDVTVREDEKVSGQVVAVLGDVRIDGEVGDQVVAVLGSIDLGPRAVVRGDVVSVGGHLRRAQGSQVRGGVTEVAIGKPNVWVDVGPWFGGPRRVQMFSPFGATARLVGTTFHYVFLAVIASIALLLGRRSVEGAARRVADNPLKATLIGVAAWILFVPMLVVTVVVLAVSIIGIPLLLFTPIVVLIVILMALAGFSGTAYAVGQGARRRFGFGGTSPLLDVWVGILIILLPVLLARVTALGGWPLGPIVFLLLALGVAVEALAWASGFGAILANSFSRWQASRAMRAAAAPPAAPGSAGL